jgi:hypothetical protein
MRLILSRKGFDSSNGGCASPILPDGRLLTLPIPSAGGLVRYRELRCDGVDVAELVRDLTRGAYGPDDVAHLDPDLVAGSVPRPPAWRPAFGQVENAQVHLANQQIGAGDLFLYFGWFREVERANGRWMFRRGAPDLHVLFGWLQVGELIDVVAAKDSALRRHPWLRTHPHLSSVAAPNVVYISADDLALPGVTAGALPGAGVFPRIAPELVLTRSGQRLRSRWRLPAFFYPKDGRAPLSYHEQPDRWSPRDDGVDLQTVGRGQEFVLDLSAYPEAVQWVLSIVATHGERP